MFFLLLIVLPAVRSLTCTQCPHVPENPSVTCSETCEGDLCYIVVNEFFNATLIAGCLPSNATEERESRCFRHPDLTICTCTSSNECNHPAASASQFEFSNTPPLDVKVVLPNYVKPEPKVFTQPPEESVDDNSISQKMSSMKSMTSSDDDNMASSDKENMTSSDHQMTSEEPTLEVKSHMEVRPPVDQEEPLPKPSLLPTDEQLLITKTVGLTVDANKSLSEPTGSGSIQVTGISQGPSHPMLGPSRSLQVVTETSSSSVVVVISTFIYFFVYLMIGQ